MLREHGESYLLSLPTPSLHVYPHPSRRNPHHDPHNDPYHDPHHDFPNTMPKVLFLKPLKGGYLMKVKPSVMVSWS